MWYYIWSPLNTAMEAHQGMAVINFPLSWLEAEARPLLIEILERGRQQARVTVLGRAASSEGIRTSPFRADAVMKVYLDEHWLLHSVLAVLAQFNNQLARNFKKKWNQQPNPIPFSSPMWTFAWDWKCNSPSGGNTKCKCRSFLCHSALVKTIGWQPLQSSGNN